ncbi:MAG: phosphoribosylanthranilate isomerase, partial [Chromatiales bacterium]
EAGADAIGFVFAKSVRQITAAQAAAISAAVPAHIKRVAVMLHPANEEWQAVLREFLPNALQTDAEDFALLDVPHSVEQWPVFREGGLEPDTSGTYVYEGHKSGQGVSVDWSLAAEFARDGNMILAGGLAVPNVAEAIATVRPFGVDVSSAVESAPGQKDEQLIKNFLSAVRAAEKNL